MTPKTFELCANEIQPVARGRRSSSADGLHSRK